MSSSFEDTLWKALEILQRRKRVSCRALKRELAIDDDLLDDLKFEITHAQRLADDEEGVLVWKGPAEAEVAPLPAPAIAPAPAPSPPPRPIAPTPLAISRTVEAMPAPNPDDYAERRQLTVMFCDLVGSTPLSGVLDAEDFHQLVVAYQQAVATVIERQGGHVAQYQGDGIIAFFGYPKAHEGDPRNAVQAGLDAIEAMKPLSDRLEQQGRPRLGIRIGLHTGEAVIGELGAGIRRQQLALGQAPNVAARVQGAAQPDQLVISQTTYRLVEDFFEFADLGEQSLKGVAEPVRLYHVLRASEARTRLDHKDKRQLTGLVGREVEAEVLARRWRQACDGRAHAVLLSGEAGIGKSRLVREILDATTADQECLRLTLYCTPFTANSALHPVIDHLQRRFGFHPEMPAEVKHEALEQALVAHSLPLAEVVPLFAELLSLPPSKRFPPTAPSPRQKRVTLEWLVRWFTEQARAQPVIMVWEDLHWADPSTIELQTLLLERAREVRLLSLFTFRPEFLSPWPESTTLSRIDLVRFSPALVQRMVSNVLGGKTLPLEVAAQIAAKTDGVPLFIEEVTKLLLESGYLKDCGDHYALTGVLPAMAVPDTLHDSLMARLDRLLGARDVAQIASVVGREFSYSLLRRVIQTDEVTLRQALDRLVEAELLLQHGRPPDANYSFKHALIQDVAYGSLLKRTRQQYHERLAHVLEENYLELVETQPELLAHHWTLAGSTERAIMYWRRAGERGIARSAHIEAIVHLGHALELLRTLPATQERKEREVSIHIQLGVSLAATRGYGAPEVRENYATAHALCAAVGDPTKLFAVVYGQWRSSLLRAEYENGLGLGEQLLDLAEKTRAPALLVAAHRSLGAIKFYMGEYESSLLHLQHVTDLPSTEQLRREAYFYDVVDSWVTAHSYKAWNLWMLGLPESACFESDAAVALAASLEHPFTDALALSFASWLHQFRRDTDVTRQRADAALQISGKQGLEMWIGWSSVMKGWTIAQQGRLMEGIPMIQDGIRRWQATGSSLGLSYFLALLAGAYGRAGRLDEALVRLDQAQDFVERSKERFWEPEINRLRGELLARQGAADATVEESLQRAIDLATQRSARVLELRASVSLGRLWQRSGRGDEARTLVTRMRASFRESRYDLTLREAESFIDGLEWKDTDSFDDDVGKHAKSALD